MSVLSSAARAGEQLRRHVAARARHFERFAFVELPQARDAEIDELQPAVGLEHDVLGLDVAMDDAGAMQRRHRLRELERDVEPAASVICGRRTRRCSSVSPS